MRARRSLTLFAALLLVGCAGGESALDALSDAASGGVLSDLWAGLPDAAPGDCSQNFRTYYTFGVRDLACHGAAALAPAVLVDRAPVRPFLSGPHVATSQRVALDLHAGRAFGHYDPAFVRWATGAAVATSPTARQFVRPIYRAHVARSARIYWLAYEGLAGQGFPATVPSGPLGDYAAYLAGGPVTEAIEGFDGGDTVSTYRLVDALPPLAPAGEVIDEGPDASGVEASLTVEDFEIREAASTALAFWIRRDADGTQDEWRAGLRAMLQAYDADWLASHGG